MFLCLCPHRRPHAVRTVPPVLSSAEPSATARHGRPSGPGPASPSRVALGRLSPVSPQSSSRNRGSGWKTGSSLGYVSFWSWCGSHDQHRPANPHPNSTCPRQVAGLPGAADSQTFSRPRSPGSRAGHLCRVGPQAKKPEGCRCQLWSLCPGVRGGVRGEGSAENPRHRERAAPTVPSPLLASPRAQPPGYVLPCTQRRRGDRGTAICF